MVHVQCTVQYPGTYVYKHSLAVCSFDVAASPCRGGSLSTAKFKISCEKILKFMKIPGLF